MSRVASTNQDFFNKFAELTRNPEAYGGKVTNPGRSLTALVCTTEIPLWRIETGYLNPEQKASFKAALDDMLTRGAVVVGYSYFTPIYIAQWVDGKLNWWEVDGRFSTTTSRHQSGYRLAV